MSKLIAVAVAAALLLLPVTAEAHTDEQLDQWTSDWSWSLWAQGGITYQLWMQRWDMANRHPCYFRDDCPPPHTHTQPAARTFSGGVEQWRGLVAAYFRAGDVDRALRIMQCESGGNPNAQHGNRPSGAAGLMQHLPRYWVARSAAAGYGGVSIFDPTANVAVAAWLRDQPGGFSHWECR